MKKPEVFYSKILLFGEYTVMQQSTVLSIPFTHYQGSLRFLNSEDYTDYAFAHESNRSLLGFYNYLEQSNHEITKLFDIERFKHDIDHGIYFESSIPQGYGIGSSGALVAAFYTAYAYNPLRRNARMKQNQLLELKQVFSILESYFHGKSSGIDPLNAYFSHPISIDKGEIKLTRLPRPTDFGQGAIFLLDTGKIGKTGPLVNLYLEKCKDNSYLEEIENKLIPLNNSCIQNLVEGNLKSFYATLKKFSKKQLELFKEMIPTDFQSVWQEGLENDQFVLKLLGSGGGGFLLGFTADYENTAKLLAAKGMNIIPVYVQSENLKTIEDEK